MCLGQFTNLFVSFAQWELAEERTPERDHLFSRRALIPEQPLAIDLLWSVHFACEYGLRQMAIESGGKEPGPAQLVATIEEARREGIRVVFAQKGFSDRSARVIAAELDARVEELDPLAHDWLENLRFSAARIAAALR